MIDVNKDGTIEDPDSSGDEWRPMNVYVHGPGVIGQILKATWYEYDETCADPSVPCDTGEYWCFYDALGNVNGVLKADGDYIRFEMDAFGNDLDGGNSFLPMDDPGSKEHLTGKMYDTATGLYYFHARWYDPEVGRFVSRDPVEIAAAESYIFCRNSPVAYIDTSGAVVHSPARTEEEEKQIVRDCRREILNDTEWNRSKGVFACSGQAGEMCTDQGGFMDCCLKRHGIDEGLRGMVHIHFEERKFLPFADGAYHTYCVACSEWSGPRDVHIPTEPWNPPWHAVTRCRWCINLDDTYFPEPEFMGRTERNECEVW